MESLMGGALAGINYIRQMPMISCIEKTKPPRLKRRGFFSIGFYFIDQKRLGE